MTEAVLTWKGGTRYYTAIAGWLDRHTLLLFAKDPLLVWQPDTGQVHEIMRLLPETRASSPP